MAKSRKAATVINFQAQVWAIKTTIDGGVNVTLSLSEKNLKAFTSLLECKERKALLEVAAVPILPEAKVAKKNVRQKRVRRYPYRD